jgi:hypothetical protein
MGKRQGKPQTRAYKEAYREAHRAEINAHMREYYRKNKKRHLAWMRKNRCRRYGLMPDEYQQLKKAHGGRCAICNKRRKLQIDHDHKTGIVRGLVCQHCNNVLGRAFDDVTILQQAIRYLKRFLPVGKRALSVK